ncbi:MAG: hypothetical protein ACP5QK_02525 [Myxococcota bacterium]
MKDNKSIGLCETCIRKEHCSYIKTNSEPVHFCEEFTNGCGKEEKAFMYSPTKIAYEEGYEGLCKNCENRKMCSICQKGVPIWQCEEYI